MIIASCCPGADPVLGFSTYLGGSDSEFAPSTAVAADGSVFVAMATQSPDLPVPAGAAQKALAPGTCKGGAEGGGFPVRCADLYIAKLSPSGAILRATYLGGSDNDFPIGIQLDRAGNVWVAGSTLSADFPRAKVIGTPAALFSGGFVVELSADLGTILQSTVVIGGPASAFALDGSGASYIAGGTSSTAPPTLNAIQPNRTPGLAFTDGFVAKLAPGGELVYATYFGGNGATQIAAMAVDATGGASIGGYTEADDLPGNGARYGKRSGTSDAFVARIAMDGKSAPWVRYLGGSGYDQLVALAMDAAGDLYAGGITSSPDFPGDDYSGENPGLPRGFVSKVSADGTAVLSSRMFGHFVAAMALDGNGAIWLTGTCCSGVLAASASALQAARDGYATDAYLVQLGETGPPLWASYIGGTGEDSGTSVSSTADGVVLAGLTQSFDFPLNHAAQKSLDQNPGSSPVLDDAFVMRFGSAAAGAPSIAPDGVKNAASYRAGEAAPGSIVSIFGDDLAAVVRQASALPLPSTLGDTGVTVNGVAAPLYYVSPSQINAQIPFETAVGTAAVQVSHGGTAGAVQQLAIVPVSPGLFAGLNGINSVSTAVKRYFRPWR